MHSDCLCSSFHPNFSIKIYQLLKKWILNVHSVLEEMFICSYLPSCLSSNHASTKMALALVCVCVCVSLWSSARITFYAKNSKVERSEQERKHGDGCINKGNGVSGNHLFVIFTPMKLAIDGILIPYTLMQHNKVTMISISPKLSLYTYFLLTCQTVWHK